MPASLHYSRLWWTVGLGLAAAVVILSLMPDPPHSIPVDKNNWAGHFIAYGTLMAWFARLAPPGRGRIVMAVVLCLLGVSMEYAQRATGYRNFDVMDMVANATGVGLGWLVSPPRAPHGIAQLDRLMRSWLNPRSVP